MHFGILIGTLDSPLSLLRGIRGVAPFGRKIQLHKFLRNVGFCVNTRTGGNGVFFGHGSPDQHGLPHFPKGEYHSARRL